MIEDKPQLQVHESEGSQRRGNLKLASHFIRELVDRIEADETIPESGTIVLLPSEDDPDPGLFEANMRMAQELAAEGRNVILWTVGNQESFDTESLDSSPVAGEQD